MVLGYHSPSKLRYRRSLREACICLSRKCWPHMWAWVSPVTKHGHLMYHDASDSPHHPLKLCVLNRHEHFWLGLASVTSPQTASLGEAALLLSGRSQHSLVKALLLPAASLAWEAQLLLLRWPRSGQAQPDRPKLLLRRQCPCNWSNGAYLVE